VNILARTFNLEVVTPDKYFYSGEVEMVVVRTLDGDKAFMANHMWTVAPIATGKLKIRTEDGMRTAACSGGFIHIKEDKTTIVTDSAEWPEDIDIKRAEEAKKRAEAKLAAIDANTDIERAKVAVYKALNRIHISEEHINIK